MMFPYVLLFTAFTIVPVVMSFLLSFTYFNMLEFPTFIGVQNYLTLFLDDEIFIIALKNTLIIAVVCGPRCPMAVQTLMLSFLVQVDMR